MDYRESRADRARSASISGKFDQVAIRETIRVDSPWISTPKERDRLLSLPFLSFPFVSNFFSPSLLSSFRTAANRKSVTGESSISTKSQRYSTRKHAGSRLPVSTGKRNTKTRECGGETSRKRFSETFGDEVHVFYEHMNLHTFGLLFYEWFRGAWLR